MNTPYLLRLVTFCGLAATLHAQTPPLVPSGPPSDPTTAMKSLNQVEPRTIIGSLPYTITQSGSYYLGGNLEFTAATGDAITVNASHVTIDLMGFKLSSTAAVTGSGIKVGAGAGQLAVKNGAIVGATTVNEATWNVTPGGFSKGIEAVSGATCGRFSDLSISGCRAEGVLAPKMSTIENVTASRNGSAGILAPGGVLKGCVASTNAGGIVPGITSPGINAENITACTAKGNEGGGIVGSIISDCTASENGGTGLFGYVINSSQAVSNHGDGIYGDSVSFCTAMLNQSNGIVADQGTVSHSSAHHNTAKGIVATNGVVSFSIAHDNTDTNLDAAGATRTGNNPAP